MKINTSIVVIVLFVVATFFGFSFLMTPSGYNVLGENMKVADDANYNTSTEEGEESISLEIRPVGDGQATVGETEKYEIVAHNANLGVQAYDIEVQVNDSKSAKITEWSETKTTSFSASKIVSKNGTESDKGYRLDLVSALADNTFEPSEEIVVATFEVLSTETKTDEVSIEFPEGEDQEIAYLKRDKQAIYQINDKEGSSLYKKWVNLDIRPVADGKTTVGETEEYRIVAEGSTGGISGYDISVEVNDSDDATIVDWDETKDPLFSKSKILGDDNESSDNGYKLELSSALGSNIFNPSDESTIAVFEVSLDSKSSVSIDFSANESQEVSSASLNGSVASVYNTRNKSGSILQTIEDVIYVGQSDEPASDTNGDGRFNDVNGDGSFNVFDVQSLFGHFEDTSLQNNPDRFDFDGDNSLSIFDVQALFKRL